jgi:Mrp family chromosome partitioning ATPase
MTWPNVAEIVNILPAPIADHVTQLIDARVLFALGLVLLSSGIWWTAHLAVSARSQHKDRRKTDVSRSTSPEIAVANRTAEADQVARTRTTETEQVPVADGHRSDLPTPSPERARALGNVRVDVGSVARHHPSFVQLYYAIEARRTSAMPLVVQFLSPTPGTGASTVASGYARVAADDCSQPVVYVDCTGSPTKNGKASLEPPTLMEVLQRGLPLTDAMVPARDSSNLLWARLSPGPRPLLNIGADRLQSLLDVLRAQHPLVVLDSGATSAPEAAALSRYCDGSVLVVAAGRTRQSEIDSAKTLIERLGGQTVGVVLNRQQAVLPRWLDRRL